MERTAEGEPAGKARREREGNDRSDAPKTAASAGLVMVADGAAVEEEFELVAQFGG